MIYSSLTERVEMILEQSIDVNKIVNTLESRRK